MVNSKVEILLTFSLVFILCNFAAIGNEFSTTRNFLKRVKETFKLLWRLSTWLKIILKTLEMTSNDFSTAVLWSNYESGTNWCFMHFWEPVHYGKSFVLLSYFKVKFFAVFDVSFNNFFLILAFVNMLMLNFYFYLEKLLLIVWKCSIFHM